MYLTETLGEVNEINYKIKKDWILQLTSNILIKIFFPFF